MKALLGFCVLAFVGAVGWQIGGTLSSDALGMAIGILFGIMAGIPATLILLASARREDEIRYQAPPARPQAPQSTITIENHYHLHVHGAHKPVQDGRSIAKTQRTQQQLSIPK